MGTNDRCERCEREVLREVVRKFGRNAYVDLSKMTSRCKVPRFMHNDLGMDVVVYWDCEKQTEVVYSQKEWLRKRASGEL